MIGRLLNSARTAGLLFTRTGYSVAGELRGARRQNQVLQIQRVRDIDRRKLLGVQLVEIQIHHDLPVLAAERIGNGRALHGAERRADEVVRQIEDFLLLQRLAAQPELQDRNAGRVVLQNLRREHPRRHVADLNLALRHDLRQRHIDLHVRMEVDANHRDALVRLRFDVFDVVDVRGESALEIGDDRLSISSGDRPLYCQRMLTIGISMYGKISTGMVAMATPPRMAISTAITTKV